MPKFIILDDLNIVENQITADSLEIAQAVTDKTCIELPSEDFLVHMGDLYDGTSFVPDRNGPERYAPFVPEVTE
jgi:hypothetical protein